MCTAQCGSMEAKAFSFVSRAAGSEHHQSSTRRVFTYVVGGRVGMNDTCYFTLDMKKLDPTPVEIRIRHWSAENVNTELNDRNRFR